MGPGGKDALEKCPPPRNTSGKGSLSQWGPSGGGLGPEGQAGSLEGVQGEDLLTAAQLGLLEAAQGLGV